MIDVTLNHPAGADLAAVPASPLTNPRQPDRFVAFAGDSFCGTGTGGDAEILLTLYNVVRSIATMMPRVRPLLIRGAVLAVLTGCSVPAGSVVAPSYVPSCPPDVASSAQSSPPDLPADIGVGPGVFVYRPCPHCGAWLLTRSGRRYALPTIPRTPLVPAVPTGGIAPFTVPIPVAPDPLSGVRLSPDGRWLLRPGDGDVVMRDLRTTEVRHLPGHRFTPGAWSDDGRWLVLDNDQSGPDLLDVTTGQRQPIRFDQSHAGWRVDAVLGPHEVVLQQAYDYERRDTDPRH